MKTEDLRHVLMLGSVEETDSDGLVLPFAKREEASILAGAPLPNNPSRGKIDAFLANRARILLDTLRTHYFDRVPWLHLEGLGSPASRYPLFVALFLLAAGALGFLTSELGPAKKINIVSAHLFAILGWSMLVYLREIALLFRPHHSKLIEAALSLFHRRAKTPPLSDDPTQKILHEAKVKFERRWAKVSHPIAYAKLKSLLHWAALILAAAAIAGMYVKGIANEYLAIWESTFITTSDQLLPILHFVLGPALALSDGTLPSSAELEAIRGAHAEGENAARWIHWYAITIGLFVLIPRACLALIWRFRASRIAATFSYRETAPRYYGRLLATSSGASQAALIVPYAITLDDAGKTALVRRLEDEFRAAVAPVWSPTIHFGEEEDIAIEVPSSIPHLIPLFSFSATPEQETHLSVYRTLSTLSPNPLHFILLDASAFDQRSQGLADAEERRMARANAWRHLFANEGVALLLEPEVNPFAPAPLDL